MTSRLSAGYTPAITIGRDGVVDIVAVDRDGSLVHCHTRDRLAEVVATRMQDTRVFAGTPALVRRRDGSLELFCRDVRGHVRHARYSEGAGWSTWRTVGDMSRAVVGRSESGGFRPGREQLYPFLDYEGDSRLPAETPRVFRSPADVRVGAGITAVVCTDGHVELFASDLNRALWRSVEVAGGAMAPWRRVEQPGIYTQISAAPGPHGGPLLVGASRDGVVWAGCVDGADGAEETHPLWTRLDAHITGAPVIWAVRGRYAILGRGADARPWQTFGTGHGGWSAWEPVPGTPLLPADVRIAAVAENSDGLRVCARGVHGDILYSCYGIEHGWSPWSVVGGPVSSQVNIAADPDGGVHIVGIDAGDRLVRVWHESTERAADCYEVALR